MAVINQVGNSLTGATGTGKFVGETSAVMVTPTIGAATGTSLRLSNSGILDNNGVSILTLNSVASAVNYITISNNIAGSRPYFEAIGSDTNIVLSLNGKGTGGVEIEGTSTNDNANTGYVGQVIESVVLASAPGAWTFGAATNLTSISLTAGDWDVYGNVGGVATTITLGQGWINSVSASAPDQAYMANISPATAARLNLIVPTRRVSLSSTTTYYISGAFAGSGTLNVYGAIWARRAR